MLRENFRKIKQSNGTAKAYHLIQRIYILREQLVWDIQRELQEIINKRYWVSTDDKGSGFDTRYISTM